MKLEKLNSFIRLNDTERNFLHFHTFHLAFLILSPIIGIITFMLRRAHRLKLINCNKKGMFKLLGVGFVFLGLYFVLLIGDIYILPHMRIITTLLTNQPVNIYHFFNITGVIIAVLCLVHLATLPEVENHEHS